MAATHDYNLVDLQKILKEIPNSFDVHPSKNPPRIGHTFKTDPPELLQPIFPHHHPLPLEADSFD